MVTNISDVKSSESNNFNLGECNTKFGDRAKLLFAFSSCAFKTTLSSIVCGVFLPPSGNKKISTASVNRKSAECSKDSVLLP